MHQYKTIAQTLFVLSILNFVYAAPLLQRETRNTVNEVVAEDATVSDRRRGALPLETDGTTPPPADGSPTTHLSDVGEAPLRDPTMVPSTSVNPLSTTGGPAPVPDSNHGASTSSHAPAPLEIERPVSVPGSAPGSSTGPTYFQVDHDMLRKDPKFYQRPAIKKIAGFSILTAFIAGFVLFSSLSNRHKDD